MKKGDLVGFFKLVCKIGDGGFGGVWLAQSTEDDEFYAMKVEPTNSQRQTLRFEAQVLKKMKGTDVTPLFKIDGNDRDNFYCVMELCGPNLSDIAQNLPEKKFSMQYIPRIAHAMFSLVEVLHNKGYIHRDIKPQNFVIRMKGNRPICLIDFGISRIYLDANGNHIDARHNAAAMGSMLYASANSMDRVDLSRRDDLISLIYSIMDLAGVEIPWRGKTSNPEVLSLKKSHTLASLVEPLGQGFVDIANHIQGLQYADAPNYESIRKTLESMFTETPKPYQWMEAPPIRDVIPNPEFNNDPTGFILSISPYIEASLKRKKCYIC